jgi:hypothetical protein
MSWPRHAASRRPVMIEKDRDVVLALCDSIVIVVTAPIR